MKEEQLIFREALKYNFLYASIFLPKYVFRELNELLEEKFEFEDLAFEIYTVKPPGLENEFIGITYEMFKNEFLKLKFETLKFADNYIFTIEFPIKNETSINVLGIDLPVQTPICIAILVQDSKIFYYLLSYPILDCNNQIHQFFEGGNRMTLDLNHNNIDKKIFLQFLVDKHNLNNNKKDIYLTARNKVMIKELFKTQIAESLEEVVKRYFEMDGMKDNPMLGAIILGAISHAATQYKNTFKEEQTSRLGLSINEINTIIDEIAARIANKNVEM